MKGIIWKYLAETDEPGDLHDDTVWTRCAVDNPDPDFWEHPFPVWSVCGPMVRPTLKAEDVLFFTPTLARGRRAGVPDYTCTAYLTVARIVPDRKAFLREKGVTAKYKRNYLASLRRHEDKDRIRELRRRSIIIGDPERSHWLGRSGPALPQVLKTLGIESVALNTRRVKNLTENEAVRFRQFLIDSGR